MSARSVAAAFCLVAAQASAAELPPDQAFAIVVRSPWTKLPAPKPEEVAAAKRTLAAAVASEPASARLTYGLAHATRMESRTLKGDAAKKERKKAQELFAAAAERDPGNADYQYWLGDATFERTDDVNMISKMSLATSGRKAFEKAVGLDPNHVAARVWLGQFYLRAPAVVGGGAEKAKAQGEALLTVAGGRGGFQGHLLLAGVAARARDWGEMSRQFNAAETAGGDGADPAAAMRSQAWLLMSEKKDPQGALPVVERYLKLASPDDLTALYLDGEVKRQLGKCADALPRFDQVLAKEPAARGSRWGAAVCRESLGQKEAARRDYEEFAKRYPDDDRAKEAKAAAKRLSS